MKDTKEKRVDLGWQDVLRLGGGPARPYLVLSRPRHFSVLAVSGGGVKLVKP